MKTLHLICNAHIDPVWQWEWEEGAACAVSTFRAAAEFCEMFDGFVFNHNEAILYEWIREYEPHLFERIRRLVAQGKWHIMGGWYLQPDCNMPSGESLVRQILAGRDYFQRWFGQKPTTAINFDSFGHSRGLVQILRKSGFDSYLFCRPGEDEVDMASDDFRWIGYDGSEVLAHRAFDYYNSELGAAARKVRKWLDRHEEKTVGLLLWGVGNHGGGPSREDIRQLNALAEETTARSVVHSTPEAYFAELRSKVDTQHLPRHEQGLNPHAVGCYTSQIRIKQKHRLLENELYVTEKMLSAAALQGLLDYPSKPLLEASQDLMTAQFHDILPGSSVETVEESSLRILDHGLEIVSRLKAKAFFALAAGQPAAEADEFPILLYNPHPYPVTGIFECEFQLPVARQHGFREPTAYLDGERIECQTEKELGNMKLDWRKRVVFRATLPPSQMTRIDCRTRELPEKPLPRKTADPDGHIRFATDELTVVINGRTGLMDRYEANGVDCVSEGAFRPVVVSDTDNPWAHGVEAFSPNAEAFELLGPERGSLFSGTRNATIPSVRIVEDGEVRTVVEAVFGYGDSFLCQQYKLPKQGTEVEIVTRVYWNEKSKFLKLSVPVALPGAKFVGQDAFGVAELAEDGKEVVSQKWLGLLSEPADAAFTCINDGTYASDFRGDELRLSLLRSPAYTAFALEGDNILAGDRFIPRIDQGERQFRFRINAGKLKDRLANVDREATAANEKPYALSFYPSGQGAKPLPLIRLDGPSVLLSAFKKAEKSDDFIIRLYNPVGERTETVALLPLLGMEIGIGLGPYEVKSLRIDARERSWTEVDLVEEPVPHGKEARMA